MTDTSFMHIGLDDTDSTKGGCTTYLAAVLIEKLAQMPIHFIDYPALIRLNPNVPWKTRGNGALCLRLRHPPHLADDIKQLALNLWEQHSHLNNKGTNPGIVFYQHENIPKELTAFSRRAETSIVTLKEAIKLIRQVGAEALGYNTCRGIIGATAAIGETLNGDYTYELIAYRTVENWGTKRCVDKESIFNMDQLLQPKVFNNVDTEKNRVIITPRGPDPILFGIRGESADVVKQAFGLVKSLEPVERWVIFRSNQGTDVHLRRVNSIDKLERYSSVILQCVVSKNPRIVPVRHVIFSIKDAYGEMDCAAYEPTGDLRKIARELVVGDCIEVMGAVHRSTKDKHLTINLEKINILNLNQKVVQQNPFCPNCQKRLKSMGKHQGLRCERCGEKFVTLKKQEIALPRTLKPGLYLTSARSQRHLTKPLRRFGQEKQGESVVLIEGWHSP
ncbi:MAG: tRNA(Ile)(2)-agmatinylcytidine synthase [Candidatus Bathyarchaeota archaeon]|nr:tRNA(Ile)(2)-agmatinylcytidine synthase [Candidatus Termiticorpusculum sp.]